MIHVSVNIHAEIYLSIQDVFSQPAIFPDLHSTITLAVRLNKETTSGIDWSYEDPTSHNLTKVGSGPHLKMTVDENFRFGWYWVHYDSESHKVNIPYRLGEC